MSIKKLNQNGIGLVEVIAALGITLMTVTALVSMALFTLRSSLNSKLTLEGSKIAARELELVRAYRDRSATWYDFTNGLISSGCIVNPGTGSCHMDNSVIPPVPVTGAGTDTIDSETVTRLFTADIDAADPNIVYVSVTVSWVVSNTTHQTHLYTYLTNWRNE